MSTSQLSEPFHSRLTHHYNMAFAFPSQMGWFHAWFPLRSFLTESVGKMRLPSCCLIVRQTHLLRLFLLVLLVGAVFAALQSTTKDQGRAGRLEGLPKRKGSPAQDRQEEQFTIIIQTYSRTDILLKLLNHYQAMPRLQRIIVVWNNIGALTPEALWLSFGPHPVQVVFKEQTVNRVRNRLQLFDEIATDAVLMIDDDILISLPDISFAFSVWKQFPDQIVGFVPRKHVSGPSGVYIYGGSELRDPESGGGDRYSMVLIDAAFYHRYYLWLFQKQPKEVHALLDETQNCDDIAMNFVVALYLRKQYRTCKPSGVLVKPVDFRNLEREARSDFRGLWHRPEHLLQRSYCLNTLTTIYGFMPLCFSNMIVSQFGFPGYPGF